MFKERKMLYIIKDFDHAEQTGIQIFFKYSYNTFKILSKIALLDIA